MSKETEDAVIRLAVWAAKVHKMDEATTVKLFLKAAEEYLATLVDSDTPAA